MKREQYSFVELGTEGLDLYPTGRQLRLGLWLVNVFTCYKFYHVI